MYNWIVFLHLAGIFGFLLAHGASVAASFVLKRERNLERVRALLDVSTSTYGLMYISVLVFLIAGIALGFMGGFWGRGWIWASLVLLVIIMGAMSGLGSRIYGSARKLAGLPYLAQFKIQPPLPPASPAELNALLDQGQPMLLTIIGYGGLLIILWLMMFKPF